MQCFNEKGGIIAFIHIQLNTIQHHNVLEMEMTTQLMFEVGIGKANIHLCCEL